MRTWIKTASALLLSASLAAGCSVGKQGSDAKPTDAAKATDDRSEKLSITLMSPSYEGGGWPDKSPVLDFLDKKFNVDLKIQWVPGDNYEEKLGVLGASNSFPDGYIIPVPDFLNWRDKGVFLDLMPIIDHYPLLAKGFSPDSMALGNPKGKLLALPFYTPETRDTIVIRKDWLDKLGLQPPTTTDELLAVAKAFAKNDPDGDGKDDTVGLTFSIDNNVSFSRMIDPIKYAFGVANGWKEQNGQLIPWEVQSKELKDFLSYMQKAYAEGVIDKDFTVNKGNDPNTKAEQNKVGINLIPATAVYADGTAGSEPNIRKNFPNAQLIQLAPPKGPTGLQGGVTTATNNKFVINAKIDKKKQERILDILEYLMTDEGNTLNKNGIEGIHYQKTADNKYEKLPAFDKDRPHLISFWLFRRPDPLTTYRIWDDPSYAQKVNALFDVNKKYANPNKAAGIYSETASKLQTSLDQKFMADMIKIILGNSPVDSIDKTIEDWKKGGGDKIIAEINDGYKAMN